MRVFALEALDQSGQLRSHGAHLAAVLARFGGEGFDAAVAIALGPFQQRIDRERAAAGIGDVVRARGDLLGASSEFAARQRLDHQRRD